MNTDMKRRIGFKILKVIVLAPLFIFLAGYLLMSLWNWLVPELFHGPFINFWQALGIFVLSKILFGGFKGKGGRCCCGKGGEGGWKEKMRSHWGHLSSEERDQLRNRFYNKCGWKNNSGEQTEATPKQD